MRSTPRSYCHRRRNSRRGAVLVLAALMLIVLLGMVAFAVDIGYIMTARTEMQRAADSAALAAASGLLDERRLLDESYYYDVWSDVRHLAIQYASLNTVSNSTVGLDQNGANHVNGDIVIGRLHDGHLSTFGNASQHNAVLVRLSRTAENNTRLSLFFAPVLGVDSADVTAEAIATCRDGIMGFRATQQTGNTSLIPFAVHIDTWTNFLEGNGGSDNWSVDPDTRQVTGGSDGIRELIFYPNATESAGNFGTLQIGDSNNGTPELSNQIANGISATDLGYHGGSIELGPCSGDPGISGGIQHGLQQALGRRCSIALYDSVSGTGNNSVYNIVGFAGICIVDFWLDGTTRKDEQDYRVVLQPAMVVDDAAVVGDATSYFVYQPVVLAK